MGPTPATPSSAPGGQTPIGPSPVTDVLFVGLYERPAPDLVFQATSKPGHLLHYFVGGRIAQACNGRRYQLGPGDLIWYHEDEWVEGRVQEAPWAYFSVNFLAPRLPPPPFESRVVHPPAETVRPLFDHLLAAWRRVDEGALARSCRVHAALLDLIAAVTPAPAGPVAHAEAGGLWWRLEDRVRADLSRRVSLTDLATWCGRGEATIVRACRAAVGESPMKRVKRVRMSYARGLVRHSRLNMSEIADRLGYARVHEFSRDYRRHFGQPPSREAATFRPADAPAGGAG